MLREVKRKVKFIDSMIFGISAVGLTALTVVAVFFRFFLNRPIAWTEEVQLILVVWSVFFGASGAIREKGHVAVDIVFDMLPHKAQSVVNTLIWVLTAAAILILGKLEFDRLIEITRAGLRTSVLGLPSSIEYTGVLFACILMFISHLIVGIETVRGEDKKEEVAE